MHFPRGSPPGTKAGKLTSPLKVHSGSWASTHRHRPHHAAHRHHHGIIPMPRIIGMVSNMEHLVPALAQVIEEIDTRDETLEPVALADDGHQAPLEDR